MNLLDSQAGIPVCVLWQNMLLSQFLPPLKMWNGSFWELKKVDWRQASSIIQWEPICMLQWRPESPLQWTSLLECRLNLKLFFFSAESTRDASKYQCKYRSSDNKFTFGYWSTHDEKASRNSHLFQGGCKVVIDLSRLIRYANYLVCPKANTLHFCMWWSQILQLECFWLTCTNLN